MTLLIAATALVVSSVALYLVAQQRRLQKALVRAHNANATVTLEFLAEQEQRLNRLETYAYSGGAIDQRKKDGGVW